MRVKLLRLSLFLFLIFIPFGTKKFLFTFTPSVSEFTSAFLYASDILLVLFLGILVGQRLLTKPLQAVERSQFFLFAFLFFALISIFLASYKLLALYSFFHLALAIFAVLGIKEALRRGVARFDEIIGVLAASAFFQAVVAFLQFKFQGSIGLQLLGESYLSPLSPGGAKILVMGGRLLRAYGTMPHANILAGFLVLGLLSFYYFYLNSRVTECGRKLIVSVGTFFVALGLALTFSRSGWLVAFVTTFFVILWGLSNKNYRKQTASLLVIVVTTFCLLLAILGWAVSSRAHLSIDESPLGTVCSTTTWALRL